MYGLLGLGKLRMLSRIRPSVTYANAGYDALQYFGKMAAWERHSKRVSLPDFEAVITKFGLTFRPKQLRASKGTTKLK